MAKKVPVPPVPASMTFANVPPALIPFIAIMVAMSVIFVSVMLFYCYKFSWFYRLFHKVKKDSCRHGGELVAETLKRHGVKYIFTLAGGHISPILVASEKLGIRIVDVRHEATTVFAADAVSRLSGTIGVAAVTAGPGLTNTVTAVKNAQMAESPVLVLGGASAGILKGRGALQDIDQISIFKPICKHVASVSTVRGIVPTLRKAMQIAQTGTPGPVFVQLPIDVLYKYSLIKAELGIKSETYTWNQWITNWYLTNYLSNLFAGGFEHRDHSPLPVTYPSPGTAQVQEAVVHLTRAKRPLIIVGSQATLPPVPAEATACALKKFGIPVYLGGMARGMLGRKHPLHMKQRRRDALQDADLVILLGVVCDFRMSYGRVLSKRSRIISVNRNREQLYRNSDLFWKPSLAIQADPASFIVALEEASVGFKVDREWVEVLQQREAEVEEKNRKKAHDVGKKSKKEEEYTEEYSEGTENSSNNASTYDDYSKKSRAENTFVNPLQVLHTLEETMDPENSILVADGGDFVGTAAYILRPRGPLKWLDPGPYGTLGCGGGFALGAKLVRPECDVWIIFGDGSSGYSLMEFDTYNRFNTPVIALIGNDACWTQIAREQVPMLGVSTACMLEYTDYEKVVSPFNAVGLRVDGENKDDLEEIFKTAMIKSRAGQSVVINAKIASSDFRAGSISV